MRRLKFQKHNCPTQGHTGRIKIGHSAEDPDKWTNRKCHSSVQPLEMMLTSLENSDIVFNTAERFIRLQVPEAFS